MTSESDKTLPLCDDQSQLHLCRHFVFNRSKGHGSGCTTALRRDNTQRLHKLMVERMPKQCLHPYPQASYQTQE